MLQANNTIEEDVSVEINADLPLTDIGVPTTLEEVINFLSNIKELAAASNDGKGNPIFYVLTELSEIINHLKSDISIKAFTNDVDQTRITHYLETFEHIQTHMQELNNLKQIFENECFKEEFMVFLIRHKTNYIKLTEKFKYHVKQYIISTHSLNGNSLGELQMALATEGLMNKHENELDQHYMGYKEKLVKYNILKTYNSVYYGRKLKLTETLLTTNTFIALMLVTNSSDASEEYKLFSFFKNILIEKVVIDCEFDHIGCDGLNKSAIFLFQEGSIISNDVFRDFPNSTFNQAVADKLELGELRFLIYGQSKYTVIN